MADQITLGPEAARQMVEIARRVLSEYRNTAGHRRTWWGFPNEFRLGKTDAAHDQGDTGTVSVYTGTTKGSETDSEENLTGVYNRFGDLGANEWVICIYLNGGWELIAADPC